MKQATVSVVIPNWNGKDVIGDCLKSIENQSYQPNEVIVVENGSIDGSTRYIKKYFPKVKLVELANNRGFAGGVNAGIITTTSDYVFLFNNDAVADKDCLRYLVTTAQENDADITTSVILTENDTKIDSDGDVYTIWGMPFPLHRGLPPSDVSNRDEQIFSASGGASLYKSTLFDQIGYFDESFFAYYEDVDISMRAQLQKKQVWLSHKALVHHAMGHTSGKVPGFGREMTIRNSIYLYWKNLPTPLWIKLFPRFFYANLRLTVAAMVKGHPWRAIRAQLTALVHFPSMLVKRHAIQKNKKLSSAEFEELLSRENPFKLNASRK